MGDDTAGPPGHETRWPTRNGAGGRLGRRRAVSVGALIGALLPLAVVVAISPTTFTVLIVVLLAQAPASVSIAFAVGYSIGIAFDTLIFLALSGLAGLATSPTPTGIWAWLELLVGVLLVLLGIDQWSTRPRSGEAPEVPRWMSVIDNFSIVKSVSVSLVMSALRPKNVLMFAAASVAIGASGLSFVNLAIALAIFTVISASTVWALVLTSVIGQERVRPQLERLKTWLEGNSKTMMSVLMFFIGIVIVGRGLAGLF